MLSRERKWGDPRGDVFHFGDQSPGVPCFFFGWGLGAWEGFWGHAAHAPGGTGLRYPRAPRLAWRIDRGGYWPVAGLAFSGPVCQSRVAVGSWACGGAGDAPCADAGEGGSKQSFWRQAPAGAQFRHEVNFTLQVTGATAASGAKSFAEFAPVWPAEVPEDYYYARD